ncbi:ABC transporter ATP-binding protein [Gelidibacter salicanalis]|uniref:ABC transporter ATP-binding protein n=1 Tax=Gelidibacter salicanalis TaxID=291193 RepID=A0A5C7ALJ8_9FLAO|nr:ABC transporter ATP-binding protein [Gelidibacter salicanalis]TXE09267.1 ABC transporter ATP-binding protein [Gelidibacter salicanalis]
MSNKPIIKVENIGKQYRLGTVGTGSFAHDVNRWWQGIRGKEDPYQKVGEVNDRTMVGGSEYVWALQDINFEVQQGEILGIVGKNGAGKSTLLKLLSRVTAPTTGKIICHGRIASLLEVGTGFHPELTGRENIYLNGAILGMTKKEIASKFDEIVDFAGCQKYIETPVKRYSSGMYVRLAFAVAAHLEPDILIVDEVLAVGDAEFQKKAIGKMQDVSKNSGRTVLFVSHNMAAVKSLCTRGVLMEQGKVVFSGNVDDVVNKYLSNYSVTDSFIKLNENNKDLLCCDIVCVEEIFFEDINENKLAVSSISDDSFIVIKYNVKKSGYHLNLSLSIYSEDEEYVLSSPSITDENWFRKKHDLGNYTAKCKLPKHMFNDKSYVFSVLLVDSGTKVILEIERIIKMDFYDDGINRSSYFGKWNGLVRPILEWNTEKES